MLEFVVNFLIIGSGLLFLTVECLTICGVRLPRR